MAGGTHDDPSVMDELHGCLLEEERVHHFLLMLFVLFLQVLVMEAAMAYIQERVLSA